MEEKTEQKDEQQKTEEIPKEKSEEKTEEKSEQKTEEKTEEKNDKTLEISYKISEQEKEDFKTKFKLLDDDEDGYINMYDIDNLFKDIALEKPVLIQIWKLIDRHGDERLDQKGYGLALHIMSQKVNSPLPLPTSLPDEFWREANSDLGRGESRGRTMSSEEEAELLAMRNHRNRRGAFYNDKDETPPTGKTIDDVCTFAPESSSALCRPTKKPKFQSEGKIKSESSR